MSGGARHIRIAIIVINVSGLEDVVQSVVNPTTVAGHIVVWSKGRVVFVTAVDQLLFGSTGPRGAVFVSGDTLGTFESGSATKGPTGTA